MDLRVWLDDFMDAVRAAFSNDVIELADRCVDGDEMRGALIVSFIGACAHQGFTTDQTASLVAHHLLGQPAPADNVPPRLDPELVEEMVRPIRDHFRQVGAPWRRPWDATGLHSLLLWHYATLLAELNPWPTVEAFLGMWSGGGLVDIAVPASPPRRIDLSSPVTPPSSSSSCEVSVT